MSATAELALCRQALREERETLARAARLQVENVLLVEGARVRGASSSRALAALDREVLAKAKGLLNEKDFARLRWLNERIEKLEGAAP